VRAEAGARMEAGALGWRLEPLAGAGAGAWSWSCCGAGAWRMRAGAWSVVRRWKLRKFCVAHVYYGALCVSARTARIQ